MFDNKKKIKMQSASAMWQTISTTYLPTTAGQVRLPCKKELLMIDDTYNLCAKKLT